MATVFGFKSKQTAEKLEQFARGLTPKSGEDYARPEGHQIGRTHQPKTFPVTRAYLMEVTEEITACTGYDPITQVGHGKANILRREGDQDDLTDLDIIEHLDYGGRTVEVDVYSMLDFPLCPEERFLAVQDRNGDLYALKNPRLLAKAYAAADSCPAENNITVTGMTLMPGCKAIPEIPVPIIKNPRNHQWQEGAELILMRKRCACGTGESTGEEWEVLDVSLRDVCLVQGIEDRTSCLVAAGLNIVTEWCPRGEPITACLIVPYTDCETQLPACDLDWSFAPMYACCGQDSEGDGGAPRGPTITINRMPPPSALGPGAVPGRFLRDRDRRI